MYTKQDNLETNHSAVPGWAYTEEERIAEIRQAENELERGEGFMSHDNYMKLLDDRIRSWK